MGKKEIKFWGTRFSKSTDKLVEKFTSSINFDFRLAKYDVLASIAHTKMLSKQKIIDKACAKKIIDGLKTILKDIKNQTFKFNPDSEDIHTDIQNKLFDLIGEPALKLHTARSRNDLIVLEMKMYLKDEIDDILRLIRSLQASILEFAKKNKGVIIPAYTHLQPAQYVLLSHQLLAYIEALERDFSRLATAKDRLDTMPLGACALAGTSLNIDRDYVRKILGFKALTENSIDSVSDRDFILEVLACLSILGVHLSRFAEDLILWATKEFGFIDIDFSFCTGSSIMPHKKNPDVLELIRGLSSKLEADFVSGLTLLKGLCYCYNRDLQLDKLALFDAVDTTKDMLTIFGKLFQNIKVNEENLASKLNDESLFSVDIVEYLIKKGLSYREAHDVVGRLVRDCLDKKKSIKDLSEEELKKYSPYLDDDVKEILNVVKSVNAKTSYAGTAPLLVNKQLARWTKKLSKTFNIKTYA